MSLSFQSFAQEEHTIVRKPIKSIGVGLSVSTNGVGGYCVWQPKRNLMVRAGYEAMNLSDIISSVYDFTFDEIQVGTSEVSLLAEPTYKVGGIFCQADYYLLKHLYVTGGIMTTRFKAGAYAFPTSEIPYNDVYLTPEMVGDISIEVTPHLKITPYVGMGFGRTLADNNLVAFSFEIGSYYLGKPQVLINANGLLAPSSSQNHTDGLEVIVGQLSYFYPVVKFNLSFNVFQY